MSELPSYHPKRVRNEILDESEISAILSTGNHVTLALCANNIPYAVTMSYGYDNEKKFLYFHCANKGEKLDFIKQNSNVCATIIQDNGYLRTQCDHDYASLILRGKIFIVADLEEKIQGLKVLLHHLENDPAPILERNIKNDDSYAKVTILRFEVESVIGKKYIG
jgi:nitroimidazol reductase NimA-like FMN-containing flavoprotein (pyridoxamine 5'-phosphate oxidase superfamily)